MLQATTHRHARASLLPRLVILVGLLLAGSATLYGVTTRHSYTVRLAPGESRTITVEMPMRRFGGPLEFARERNLPVRCRVLNASGSEDVGVFVTATGHGVHRMWARLWVAADAEATDGRHRRSIDFSIAGKDDWPRAVVVVSVE